MAHVTIPYLPRKAFEAFHSREQRWAELICHRRAGKTVAAVNDLQRRCLTLQLPPEQAVNPPRFAFMAPTRVRAKDIAWQYLKRYSKPIPGLKVSESELFVEYPNGGRVTIYGADNDRGMGLYLDGIVFDECDEIPPAVDAVVLPALSDRKGWAVWMGILRGRHNLYKRMEKYKGDPSHLQMMLPASTSGILDDEELKSMLGLIGESAYKMQMECDVNAAIANAIYGAQMDLVRKDGRLRPMNADPSVPIDAFFDVGHSDRGDDWAMWGQQFQARDIVLLDYHSRTGETPSYYAKILREWEDKHHQRVRNVFLPHDAANRNAVGKTHVDYLADAGIDRNRIKVVHRTPNQWDSINVLRDLFHRIYINSTECEKPWKLGELEMPSGVDCLDYYSKKVDESTGIIQDVPIHDQYSHGADALRTFAEAYRLGMIEGTSAIAKETRTQERKVLRGPSEQSYSVKRKPVAIR